MLSCLRVPEFPLIARSGAFAVGTLAPPFGGGEAQSRLARHCLALRSWAAVIPLARAIALAATTPT